MNFFGHIFYFLFKFVLAHNAWGNLPQTGGPTNFKNAQGIKRGAALENPARCLGSG